MTQKKGILNYEFYATAATDDKFFVFFALSLLFLTQPHNSRNSLRNSLLFLNKYMYICAYDYMGADNTLFHPRKPNARNI